MFAGAITALLVPFWLTNIEQGYYFTLASLLGLQILFDLGLGQVIIQIVGHEVAHLDQSEIGVLSGSEHHIERLASLMQWLRRWYLIAAIIFAVIVGLAGAYFLWSKGQLPYEDWLPIWIVLVAATAVNLTYVPVLALHEGLGHIGHIARLRMRQSMLGYGILWLVLVCNFGLWASCIVPVVSMIFTGIWVRRVGRTGNWLCARTVHASNALNWSNDIFPFQWRIGLSAISGYFIFYAFTPLIFARRGPAEAGQFGLAMAIFSALSALGASWTYVKTPSFSMHIARGERKQLNKLFLATLYRSFLFTLASATAMVLLVLLMIQMNISQVNRISEPSVLVCLAVVCVANSIIFSVAAYMRAHREEPMLPVSLVGALLTILVAYFCSPYGVFTMSIFYALVTLLVLLPWSLILFFFYFRRP